MSYNFTPIGKIVKEIMLNLLHDEALDDSFFSNENVQKKVREEMKEYFADVDFGDE